MFEKLQLLNSDQSLKDVIYSDLFVALSSIGFTKEKAGLIIEKFFELLDQSNSSGELEKGFHKFIFEQDIKDVDFKTAFEKMEKSRADRIYSEIVDLIPAQGKVVDYGCGNALVAQLLVENNKTDVTGCDVVAYNKNDVHIPILKIEEYKVDVADSSFETGYANSVLHHDENPEKVISEISRIVSSRFILIEDTLLGSDDADIEFHSKRLFINDYFYNRLLTDSDISVPARYMQSQDWISLFSAHGWKLVKQDQLGWSKILPGVFRERFVFER